MANDSKKKLHEKNVKTMSALRSGLLAYWGCYAVLRAVFYKYVHVSQLVFTGLTFCVAWLAFGALKRFAEPRFEDGKLVRAGADIQKGFLTYVWDVLYVSHFCLALSLFGPKLLWSYAVIPGAGAVLLWKKVIGPWLFSSTIEEGEIASVDRGRELGYYRK